MACLARQRGMLSGKREVGRIVIKRCRRPGRCVMACGAILRKVSGNVVRIQRAGEISTVALVAIRIDQLVVSTFVTRQAGNCRMRPGDLEVCCAVIERRGRPCGVIMARCTIMRKVSCNMVWIGSSSEICTVALVAIGIDQLIISICMACLAGNGRMCATKHKFCITVAECRWRPDGGIMACRAIV
jgi:hypothetical protein